MNYIVKPQSPLMLGENGILPLTSYDQIIMPDGGRWDGNSVITYDQIIMPDGTYWGQNNEPLTSVNGKYGNAVLTAEDVGASVIRFYTLSVPASNWVAQEDGSYTQQVAIDGLTSSNYANADIDMSNATVDTASYLRDAWSMIGRAQTVNDGIILTCFEDVPTIDMTVKLEVIY